MAVATIGSELMFIGQSYLSTIRTPKKSSFYARTNSGWPHCSTLPTTPKINQLCKHWEAITWSYEWNYSSSNSEDF